LHARVDGPPKHRRAVRPGEITIFPAVFSQALKPDARPPRHERRTAEAPYVQIEAAGCDLAPDRATDSIRFGVACTTATVNGWVRPPVGAGLYIAMVAADIRMRR
jgi:hypothetical protein